MCGVLFTTNYVLYPTAKKPIGPIAVFRYRPDIGKGRIFRYRLDIGKPPSARYRTKSVVPISYFLFRTINFIKVKCFKLKKHIL